MKVYCVTIDCSKFIIITDEYDKRLTTMGLYICPNCKNK